MRPSESRLFSQKWKSFLSHVGDKWKGTCLGLDTNMLQVGDFSHVDSLHGQLMLETRLGTGDLRAVASVRFHFTFSLR